MTAKGGMRFLQPAIGLARAKQWPFRRPLRQRPVTKVQRSLEGTFFERR